VNGIFMGVNAASNYLEVMKTDGTFLALRQSDSGYGAAYNNATNILMFEGEPQEDGAPTSPTYALHFWNLTSGKTQDFPNVIGEHDFQYDPINNTFLTLQQHIVQVGNAPVLCDEIVQLDPNGKVLWTWDTYGHIPLTEASLFGETSPINGTDVEDFTHANTLDWRYNNSIIYLNTRNTNTFYKINETTGNIIWACGEFGNFTLLGDNGQPLPSVNGLPPSLWYHCHEVKEVSPDVFLMFDNDYENNTNPNNCHSRIIEVTVNETSMTAYVSRSWEAPIAYWDTYGGAAVLLPNGDFLGDFGDPTHQFPQNSINGQDQDWSFSDTGAVFVEVNPAGQVVRTFTFPVGCYVYRVETVNNPPVLVFQNPTPAPSFYISPTPTPPPIITTPTPTYGPSSTPTPLNTPTITATPTPTNAPTLSASPSSTSTPLINSQPLITSAHVAVIIFIAALVAVIFYMRKRISNHKTGKNNDKPYPSKIEMLELNYWQSNIWI